MFLHCIGPTRFHPHRHTWTVRPFLPCRLRSLALLVQRGSRGLPEREGRGLWGRAGQWGVQRAPGDSGVSLPTVAGLWPQLTFLHSNPLLLLLDFVVSLWACVRDLFSCRKRWGTLTQEFGAACTRRARAGVSPLGVSQPLVTLASLGSSRV